MSSFSTPAHVAQRLPKKWSRVWQGQVITDEICQSGDLTSDGLQDDGLEDSIEDDD